MASWRDALRGGTALINEGGLSETPALDAQLLLAFATGASRAEVLAHGERMLRSSERETFGALVARRVAGEPVAYLIGSREFMGLRIKTDRRALIPRPETELLVEALLAAMRARHDADGVALSVADIGTGTGAIALALATHAPWLGRIFATDISPDALALARENAEQLGLDEVVTFLEGDLLAPLTEPVDVLVANLPYVARRDEVTLPVPVRSYEPALALYGDDDGLAAYRRFFAQAPDYCKGGGLVGVEFGYNQRAAIEALAREAFPGAAVRIGADYAGWDRYALVWTPSAPTSARESDAT
jgi:release factor glutamine methyltransferase